MTNNPIIKLNNDVEMPALGLGVYLSPQDKTAAAVSSAIGAGYRLIDTAAVYGNEAEVGDGIVASGIDRSQLFVTTKLWISEYGFDRALQAFDESMAKLKLDYLNLYLLHWPAPSTFDATVDSYRAMQKLLGQGRVRAIGVCNFNPDHLDRLAKETDIVPAVNQIELHPMFNQDAVIAANKAMGIVTQAWSPIGGVFTNHPKDPNATTRLLDHPDLARLAAEYGKTPAQIVLRWHIQHGRPAIPKSVDPQRIAQNIAIFDFELSEGDVAAIDALDAGARGGPDPDLFDLEFIANRNRK